MNYNNFNQHNLNNSSISPSNSYHSSNQSTTISTQPTNNSTPTPQPRSFMTRPRSFGNQPQSFNLNGPEFEENNGSEHDDDDYDDDDDNLSQIVQTGNSQNQDEISDAESSYLAFSPNGVDSEGNEYMVIGTASAPTPHPSRRYIAQEEILYHSAPPFYD